MPENLSLLEVPSFKDVGKALNLKGIIRTYVRKSQELKSYLDEHPDDWIKFQEQVNAIIDSISEELALFEKVNSLNEERLYKFKRFFVKRLRKYFLYGHYITWSLAKPYGYAGDFRIIDDIYLCDTASNGFERLWDNYFLQMGPSVATRNRKEDFKRLILKFLQDREGEVRIMDLASGPCRELKELFETDPMAMSRVTIDCYDFDDHAIQYAKALLGSKGKIHFFKKNALRMAVKKEIRDDIPYEYDLIFSTGLFDYLDERIATRLAANLRRLMKKGGLLFISNYRGKESNPGVYLMEWIAEWNLIYRTEEEFKKIFIDAGFDQEKINLEYEPRKIMQYCLAEKG